MFNSYRKIYAEILVDDSVASIDYLDENFPALEEKGIYLENAFISDDDDTEAWGRYINYVVSWAFENTDIYDHEDRAMTFEEFTAYEKGDI